MHFFLTVSKIIDKCVCEAQVYARVTQLRSANYTISVLMDWCIDVLMHKIDAKLKHEETWRTVVKNHHILASAKLMLSAYVEKHNIFKCKNKDCTSLHLWPTGASTHWRLPSWCGIFFEQDSNLWITSQTNANALGSEETDNKTSISIGYWMYILDEPYLLRF